MNPALAIGGALGALVLLTPEGKRAAGTVVQVPSSGSSAITRVLASKTVGGARLVVASNGSPFDSFVEQRRAFIARYQAQSGGAVNYPATMPAGELRAWVDAWLDAYTVAAADSSSTAVDFSLVADVGPSVVQHSKLVFEALSKGWALYGSTNYRTWPLTPLGKAVGSLLDWKRTGLDASVWASFGVNPVAIQETVDRLRTFAGELEGVSYAFPGARPSEQGATVDQVLGGIGAGAGASVEFVAGAAGEVVNVAASAATGLLGDAAGAVVRSPVFWVGILGFVAWRHYG